MIQPGDYLIAADGGLRHMRTLGITPNMVIGDMDSLDEREIAEIAGAPAEVIRHPREKGQTDLELAVAEAAARGGNPIIITAALGGRLDMTIANLMLLASDNLAGNDISIIDGPQEAFIIRGHHQLTGEKGDSVSLLAVGGPAQNIRTEGLRYPLRDEALQTGETRGISNVMSAEQADIWVKEGVLLCIHTHQN
jgi:thiamine pyrophosphokinase